MKTLRISKGEESYALTFGDDDPNYEQDRRDLLLKGWNVEEVAGDGREVAAVVEENPLSDADAKLLAEADDIARIVREAKAREADTYRALEAAFEVLDGIGSKYRRIHGRETNKIANRALKARDLVDELVVLLQHTRGDEVSA